MAPSWRSAAARKLAAALREDSNHHRPHDSLGHVPPAKFAWAHTPDHMTDVHDSLGHVPPGKFAARSAASAPSAQRRFRNPNLHSPRVQESEAGQDLYLCARRLAPLGTLTERQEGNSLAVPVTRRTGDAFCKPRLQATAGDRRRLLPAKGHGHSTRPID
jgi:hypothetical protein